MRCQLDKQCLYDWVGRGEGGGRTTLIEEGVELGDGAAESRRSGCDITGL